MIKKIALSILIISCLFTTSFAVDSEEKFTEPTIEKHVKEDEDWKKERTAETGETVSFRLIGTLPSNWDEVETYPYSFVDSLPEGEAYKEDVRIVFEGEEGEKDITDSAEITFEHNVLSARFADLKQVIPSAKSTDKIYAYYSTVIQEEEEKDLVNYAHLEYQKDDATENTQGNANAVEQELETTGLNIFMPAITAEAAMKDASSVTVTATVHVTPKKNSSDITDPTDPNDDASTTDTTDTTGNTGSTDNTGSGGSKTGDNHLLVIFGLLLVTISLITLYRIKAE